MGKHRMVVESMAKGNLENAIHGVVRPLSSSGVHLADGKPDGTQSA